MPNAMTAPRTTEIRKAIKGKRRVRPTWELADYYPKQGDWKEESYIELTDEGVRAEFVDGFVEFFEIPAILHDPGYFVDFE
jgi:hypothetical protein